MRIGILGATGRTGRELVAQAGERGHVVVPLSRRDSVDVRSPESLRRALKAVDVVVSGLGVARGEQADVLSLGARALIDSGVGRIVWLSSLGTGVTLGLGGPLVSLVAQLALRKQLGEKARSDALVRAVSGSIIHAGRLLEGPRAGGRLYAVGEEPRRWLPSITRADVAALMLSEAEDPKFSGSTAVAVSLKGSRS